MTATRKSMRFLTVLALICAMVLSIASTPVSAAGVETWYSQFKYEPSFPINGYNLTPVKTMGVSGELLVGAWMSTTDNSTTPAVFTLEVRSTSGAVLARDTVTSTGRAHVSISLNVTVGQKVKIYTGIYTNNSARKGEVDYSHEIYNGN